MPLQWKQRVEVVMLLRLILAVAIVYIIYRVGKAIALPLAEQGRKFPQRPTPIEDEDMVQDPYCNTYVPLSNAYKATVDGKTLYFCSKECFEKYLSDKGRKQ
jgi:uncharacterized protein